MPSLINTDLAQNYRRTHVGTSRFGTRQIQLYEIHIYMLSDAVAQNIYDNSRDIVLDDTDNCDQPTIAELKSNSIVEAIIRGAQQVSELAIVGHTDYYDYDPNDNELMITIGVYADTFNSGQEQFVQNVIGYFQGNSNATDLQNAIGDSVQQWIYDNEEQWDGLDVYAAYLEGEATVTYGPFNALSQDDPTVQAARNANKAKSLAARQARAAAGKTGYTPKR